MVPKLRVVAHHPAGERRLATVPRCSRARGVSELPWERAEESDARFASWCGGVGGAAEAGPWRKVSAGALAVLRGALQRRPEQRPAVRDLLEHAWTRERPPGECSVCACSGCGCGCDRADAARVRY